MQVQFNLTDFFTMSPAQRQEILLKAICETHAFHYPRNRGYRRAVEAKGVGSVMTMDDLALVLRPTAQVFKSYVDILGTPFPHHQPRGFLEWLADNLSIELPRDRVSLFRARYPSLEAFLRDNERIYSDFGFEIDTSTGTSGRATIMVRDEDSADKAVEGYRLAVYRMWGTKDDHEFIFIMPRQTRIAMSRIARMSTERLGMSTQVHFTIPFPATPDQVRIRSGRTFETGVRGWVERRVLYPFMNWMSDNYVKSAYVKRTIALLEEIAAAGKDVLLFGGWVQLHALYRRLREVGYGEGGRVLTLSAESMIGTGGGLKELYPATPAEIQADLRSVLRTPTGEPVPHRDVYGMAEANWAAAQCEHGNYHLPPWIYAVVLDQDDEIIPSSDSAGLLAAYDPFAGGSLFPNFFKTADRVRLINGGLWHDGRRVCPCGYETAYIARDSIERQDRLDEAGCAGQM